MQAERKGKRQWLHTRGKGWEKRVVMEKTTLLAFLVLLSVPLLSLLLLLRRVGY